MVDSNRGVIGLAIAIGRGEVFTMKLRANRELTPFGGHGVNRQLRSMVSTPGVYWSPKGNSYVVCKNGDGNLKVYCINGIGELRWTVESWNHDEESKAAVDYFIEGGK